MWGKLSAGAAAASNSMKATAAAGAAYGSYLATKDSEGLKEEAKKQAAAAAEGVKATAEYTNAKAQEAYNSETG